MQMHYKLELRRPASPLPMLKQWMELNTLPAIEEAEELLAWWVEYDNYYSCTGWEYRIVEVKPRKKR